MRKIILAVLLVLVLAYCDSGFTPDLGDPGSTNKDLVESVRLNYKDLIQTGAPVAHKTLDDSIKAVVLAEMVKEYPPDWDEAVTWPSGRGTFYLATLVGTDKPMKAYSPKTMDLIRSFIAETDDDGKIISSNIVEFSSLDPLDATFFQVYAKEWLDSHYGDKKLVAAEYSAGYDWEASNLFNPADSTLTPQVVNFGKLDAIGKTKNDGEWCFFSHVEWGGTCWPDPDGEWLDSDGNSVSCNGVDEYHIYHCINIDTDDGGGVDDPGDDECPNGCDDVGGGTGDDDDEEEEEENTGPTFTLGCDASVVRSETGRCSVSVSGENEDGEAYTAADFTFDWGSDLGASVTGSGATGNEWEGTAVSDVTVYVAVISEGFQDSKNIKVTARSVESLPLLDAGFVRYTGQPRADGEGIFGFYDIPSYPPGSVTMREGSGPWSGAYLTDTTLKTNFYSELHVSNDYHSSGPTWPLANATCTESHLFVDPNQSYDTVNATCNTYIAYLDFGSQVEAHEWQHESSWNSCLSSSSATRMLENVESITGDESEVAREINRIWTYWWTVTWHFSGGADGSSTGDPFWYYQGGSWGPAPGYPGFVGDGGSKGC